MWPENQSNFNIGPFLAGTLTLNIVGQEKLTMEVSDGCSFYALPDIQ
jgi:hypothetical protein